MPADSNDPQDEVISETNSSSTLVSPEGQMTPDGEAVSGDFFGDMSVSDLPRPQPPVFVTTNNTNNTGSTTGQAINHSPVSVSPPVGVSPAGASINQDDNVSTPTQESTIINDSNNRRVSWRDEVDVPSYREDFAQRFRQAQRETTVNEQTGVNSSSLPAPGSETTLRPELETVFTRRRERLGQLPESGRDFAVRAQTTAASADSPAVRNTEEVPVQEIPSTRRQLESTTETPVSVSRTSTEREPATTTIATQDSETRSTRPARESAAVDIPRQEISESVRAERASVQTNTEYQEPRTISTSTTTARESITTNAPNQESTEFVRPAREPTRANTGPQEHITTSTREAESGSNNAFGREPRSQTLVAERDVSRETTSSTQAAKIDTAGNTPLLEREPVVTTRAREAADTSKVSLSEQTTTLVTPAERGDSILARAQESVTDTQVPARELRVRVSEPEITNARVSSTSEGSSSISNASRSVAPATSTTPPSEERIVSASSRQQTVEAANIATSAGQTTQPTPNTDTSTSADQIPTRTANLKQEVTNDLAQFDREQEALAQEQIAAVEERQLQDRLASQARGEAQLTAVRETPPPVNTGSTPGPAEKIDLTPPAPETPVTPITIADTTDSVTQDLNVTPPASETLTASQAPTRPQAEEKAAATLTNNREAVPSSTLTTPSAQVEKPAPVRVSAADVAVETADQTPILERETTPVSHQTETIPNASAFARNQEDFASVRPVETVTPQTIERPVKAASTDAVVPRQPEANAPMPVETLKPPSPNIENPTRVETVNQTPQAAPIVVDDPAFAPTVAPTPATPTREALNIPVSPRETTTQTQQSTTGEIGKAASTSTKPTLNTDTATSANQTPTRTANLKQEVSNDLAQFDRDQEVLAQQQIAAVEQRQLQDRLASQARGEAQLTAVRETPPPTDTGSTPGPAEKLDLTPPAPETPVTPEIPLTTNTTNQTALTATATTNIVPEAPALAQVEAELTPQSVVAVETSETAIPASPLRDQESVTTVLNPTQAVRSTTAVQTPPDMSPPAVTAGDLTTDNVVNLTPETANVNDGLGSETLDLSANATANIGGEPGVTSAAVETTSLITDSAQTPLPTPDAGATRGVGNVVATVSPRVEVHTPMAPDSASIGPAPNTDTATSADQTPTRTANLKQEVSNDLAQFDRDQEVLAQQQIAAVEQRQLQDRLASQARGEAQLTAVRETPPPTDTGSTPGQDQMEAFAGGETSSQSSTSAPQTSEELTPPTYSNNALDFGDTATSAAVPADQSGAVDAPPLASVEVEPRAAVGVEATTLQPVQTAELADHNQSEINTLEGRQPPDFFESQAGTEQQSAAIGGSESAIDSRGELHQADVNAAGNTGATEFDGTNAQAPIEAATGYHLEAPEAPAEIATTGKLSTGEITGDQSGVLPIRSAVDLEGASAASPVGEAAPFDVPASSAAAAVEATPTSTTPLTAAAGTFAGLTGSSVADQTAADPNIETVGGETSSLQQHLQQVTQQHGIDDLRREVSSQEEMRLAQGDMVDQMSAVGTPGDTDLGPTEIPTSPLGENIDASGVSSDNVAAASLSGATGAATTSSGVIDASDGDLLTDQKELLNNFSGQPAPGAADIDSNIVDNPDLTATGITTGSTPGLEAIAPGADLGMSADLTDASTTITYDANGVPTPPESLSVSGQQPPVFGADAATGGGSDTFVQGDQIVYTDPNGLPLTGVNPAASYNTGGNVLVGGEVQTMGGLDGATVAGGQAAPMTRVQAIRAQLQNMDQQSLSQLQQALGSSAGASSLGAINLTGLAPGQVMDFGVSPQAGISTDMLASGEAANFLSQQTADGQVASFVPGHLIAESAHGAGAQAAAYDLDALASRLDNMAGSQTTAGVINIPGYGDFSYAAFMPADGQMSMAGGNVGAIGGDGLGQSFTAGDNPPLFSGEDGTAWVAPDTPNFTGMAMPAGLVGGEVGTGSTPGVGGNPAGVASAGLVPIPGTYPVPVNDGADGSMGFGYVPSPQNIGGVPADFNTAGGFGYQPSNNYGGWANYPAAGAGIGAGALIPGSIINGTGSTPGGFGGGFGGGANIGTGVGGAADSVGGNVIDGDGTSGGLTPADGVADNFTMQHPELGESGLTPGVDPLAQPVETTGALPRGDGTMDPGRMLGQATRGTAENLDRGLNPARNLGSNLLSRLRPAIDDLREQLGDNLKKIGALLSMLAPLAIPLGLGSLTVLLFTLGWTLLGSFGGGAGNVTGSLQTGNQAPGPLDINECLTIEKKGVADREISANDNGSKVNNPNPSGASEKDKGAEDSKGVNYVITITPNKDGTSEAVVFFDDDCKDIVSIQCKKNGEGGCSNQEKEIAQVCEKLKEKLSEKDGKKVIDKEIKITIGYDSSTGNDVIANEAGAVKYTGKEDYSMINTISFKAHCIREYTDKKTGQKKTKQVNVKPSARYRVCVGDCNDGLYCWPTTGRISQGPFSSFSHKNYDAVDIADNNGNGIYAPFDGSYCYKWNSGKSAPTCQNLNGRTVCTNGGVGYGCYAYATDSVNGGTYVFGHMNRSVCEKMLGSAGGSHCQKFEKGQRIGTVDHTGLSSGAHLHFGFREKKSPTSGVTKLEELFNNNQKVKVNSRISDDCSKYCTGSNCNPQGF